MLATDAVVSHASAAGVLGYRPPPPAVVHVTLDDRTHLRAPAAVRVHRIPLAAADVVSVDGLPVTSGARTVIECLRFEPMGDGRTLLDRALQKSWVTLDDLDRELRDFPGRWGTRKLKRLRVECAMGDAVSERKLHRVLRAAGITGWEANAAIDVGFAVLRFDVVFRELKLILEVDGWSTHTQLDRFQTDRTRQNAVAGLGWQVLRFTWFDIVERPAYVVAAVRRVIAARS